MRTNRNAFAAGAALIVVAGVLAIGFHMLGPLKDQRARTADSRRVGDLRRIADRLRAFNATQLPDNLSSMERDNTPARDPVTNAPYEYIRESGTIYQLCATFAFAAGTDDERLGTAFWNHPKGRYCYLLDTAKFY